MATPCAAHPRPGRIEELDALRGLAALSVVLHHLWLGQPSRPGWLVWLLEVSPLHVIGYGRPAVVFFFVLSGYALAHALLASPPRSWGVYAAQRTLRLGLPVLAALLASLALQAVTWRGPLPGWVPALFSATVWPAWPTLAGTLCQALLLDADNGFGLDPVLWSLVHEWRIALLLPAVLLFRTRAALVPLTGAAAFGVSLMLGARDGQMGLGPDLSATFLATLYFLLPFALGAWLALRGAPPALGRGARTLAGAGVLVAMALSASDLAAMAGSVLLLVLAQQPGAFRNALRRPVPLWLGRVSFSLYLIHLPICAALVHLLHRSAPLLAIMAPALPLSLAAAWALHRLAEAPAQKLARRLGKG